MKILLTTLFVSAAIAAHAADPSAAAGKPNVIIVLTDDQGYGDLSCTGNPILKTPNMDRLSREGVQFTNFHVDSYCSPTRSALMTGRYSHRVGGWGTVCGRNMLRADEVTMADVFRHNGYHTGHFGKWHLGTNYPYRPMDRGFEEWLGHGDGGTGCATDFWGNDRVNDRYIHNGVWEAKPRKGYEADVFFDAVMQFIHAGKSQPFFVYLALYNPHGPCNIPDRSWAEPYRGRGPANFYASIARVDENLGRLRAFLKDEGLEDNTVLIFLSDNGTAEGEKVFNAGMRGKKGSPYDGGHRQPCFMRWPAGGLDKPVTVEHLAAHVDLLPTLVELCSLALPRPVRFDGVSLRPLLFNPKAGWPDRTLVLGTVPNCGITVKPGLPRYGRNCSVMTDRWRLVGDCELYDMATDPGQRHDVAAEHPEVVQKLRADYKSYWMDVSARDKDMRGRPIIGASQAAEVALCAEDWYPTQGPCPWNQGDVADGKRAFGYWTVRFAEAGAYRVEVRRWPREADAPMAGVPGAILDEKPVRLLYSGSPRALPVARVRLKIGESVQMADVPRGDKAGVFTVNVSAGPAEIEAALLDTNGKPLCGAYYVYVRRN
jgi:arylsulfatase A-like enzyme